MYLLLRIAILALLTIAACNSENTLSPVVGSSPVAGKVGADIIPLEGGTWTLQIVGFQRVIFDAAGGVHAQDVLGAMDVVGDLSGSGTLLQENLNQNMSGTGATVGEMTLDVTLQTDSGPISGQFFGRFAFSIITGFIDSVVTLEGSGGFEGMTLRFHSVGPGGGPFQWDGFIEIGG